MQQVYLREKQNDSARRRSSMPWRLAIRWTVNPPRQKRPRKKTSFLLSFRLRLFNHLRIWEGPRNSVLCKTSCRAWKDKQGAHGWYSFCTHNKRSHIMPPFSSPLTVARSVPGLSAWWRRLQPGVCVSILQLPGICVLPNIRFSRMLTQTAKYLSLQLSGFFCGSLLARG